MTPSEARALLNAADLVFGDDDEIEHGAQTLNMNDVWAWATSWGEYVPNEELPTLADLVVRYGWCGVLYWTSERHNGMRSAFEDINRWIEFVRAEERIIENNLSSSKRAYLKQCYTIGGE